METNLLEFLKAKHGGVEPMGFMYAVPPEMEGKVRVWYFQEASPQPHWHMVTEGFAPYGFELTLRLLKKDGEVEPHQWVDRYFNRMFAYVQLTGKAFSSDDDYVKYEGGTLDADVATDMVGGVFVADEELGVCSGPDGEIIFLQTFPLFADELAQVEGDDHAAFVAQLKEAFPSLVLDLVRKSVLAK